MGFVAEARIVSTHKKATNGRSLGFVAVLEIPPVTSPETAVKVAITAEVKGKK